MRSVWMQCEALPVMDFSSAMPFNLLYERRHAQRKFLAQSSRNAGTSTVRAMRYLARRLCLSCCATTAAVVAASILGCVGGTALLHLAAQLDRRALVRLLSSQLLDVAYRSGRDW